MKRWISLLLVFAMTLSLCGGINLTAYADGTIEIANESQTVSPASPEETHEHDHDHAEEASASGGTIAITPDEPEPAGEEPAGSIISTEEYEAETANASAGDIALAADDKTGGGDDYIVAHFVTDGGSYVLAYQEAEDLYYVVTNSNGALAVSELENLSNVDNTMLWSVSGETGIFAFSNSGLYLTAENGNIELTGDYANAWDYNIEEGYLYYTTWADESYLLSAANGELSAYAGDFADAEGKVVP